MCTVRKLIDEHQKVNSTSTNIRPPRNLPHLARIMGLVVSILLIGGSLAACQTASQPTNTPPYGQVGSEPASQAGLIQLQDPLDEPDYYCLDVPGAGFSLNLRGALQVHTCKTRAREDEIFTFNYPAEGQIYMEAYELCVEADSATEGAELRLQECTDQPRQQFVYEDGQIQLRDTDAEMLCLAVAPGVGMAAGAVFVRRDLGLQPCAEVEAALSEWEIP
ncbi:MAG: RICIN domain-containing protein [Chloroflexi bacterium]|nr:RICIN domain-containing protein [Chloroflexota bacterium]